MDIESIFSRGKDIKYNACLPNKYRFGSDWHLEIYFDSYSYTIETLLEIIQDGDTIIDLLIYPLLYLCKHWLEITLKVVVDYGRILYPELGVKYKYNHKLKGALWGNAQKVIECYSTRNKFETPLEIYKTAELVDLLDACDPRGTRFRYPCSQIRDNNKNTEDTLDHDVVNVQDLDQIMRLLISFYSGVVWALYEEIQTKAEAIHESRATS